MEATVEKETNRLENPNKTLTQRLFIERENLCPLCGNQLDIRIKDYLGDYTIAEEAYCGHCELVTRSKDHKFN